MAAGGDLTVGTPIRAGLACSHQSIVTALVDYATTHSGEQLLRVYWYDGARDANPTSEHNIIGAIDHVKVRLGRLTQRGQKGVDSRIVRDIMTLARNRAISTAYLLSGDDDLREGVADAQEGGVRVVLLGISPTTTKGRNQSQGLIREADEHIILDRDFLAPHLSLRSDLIVVDLDQEFLAASTQEAALSEVGRLFGQAWVERTTPDEIREMASQPRIPPELDTDILIAAKLALKKPFPRVLRSRMREAFWAEVRSAETALDANPDENGGLL